MPRLRGFLAFRFRKKDKEKEKRGGGGRSWTNQRAPSETTLQLAAGTLDFYSANFLLSGEKLTCVPRHDNDRALASIFGIGNFPRTLRVFRCVSFYLIMPPTNKTLRTVTRCVRI